MDQRRQFVIFLIVAGAWMYIAQWLFPEHFPKPKPPGKQVAANAEREPEPPAAEPDDEPARPLPDDLPQFPQRTLLLGQAGFRDGYLIQARVSTTGAAVDWVQLTDPRFTTLDRRDPLKVVGNTPQRNVGEGPVPRSFETSIPAIDDLLKPYGKSLADVDWEVVDEAANGSAVTFRYPSPDGRVEIRKSYRVPQSDLLARDKSPVGYLLDVQLEVRNNAEKPLRTDYSLMGPVGLPLEDAENARLFREIKLGALHNPRKRNDVTAVNMTAAELVKQFDKAAGGGKPVNDWREPLHYGGVDVQFFTALVLPQGSRAGDGPLQEQPADLVAVTRPELIYRDRNHAERSDLTIVIDSPEMAVPAGEAVTHEFQVFFGPKRPALMNALQAEPTVQLGWFSPVSKLMLHTLDFFHRLGLPYALSIIALTIVVRLLMFPISKKQAIEGEKMRILAPKMKELQDRYKGEPEQYVKALREFQKKHNYHPLHGCLPALLQLPIFLGLYNALFHAVDLRLARFLWIENLAAPDALFPLGFRIPLLGWTEFNLLPFVTVALFVAQQKLFMPPPTSEEQAMQYRVMNFMMIAIGFMFYRVPAGLCLYFIASSLWGMGERLWFKRQFPQKKPDDAHEPEIVPTVRAASAEAPPQPKPAGWWERMVAAADQAKNATEGQSSRKYSKARKSRGTKPQR